MSGKRVEFSTRFDLALIFYLAHTGTMHSREHLAGLLWPGEPMMLAKNNLRSCLSRLRMRFDTLLEVDRHQAGLHTGCFALDHSGLLPIAEGLRISQPFDTWLASIRQETYIALPEWCRPHRESAATHLGDFCRGIMPGLILRGDHLSAVEEHRTDLMRMAISAPDPANNFVAGALLFHYTMITQSQIGFFLSTSRSIPQRSQLLTSAAMAGTILVRGVAELPVTPTDYPILDSLVDGPGLIISGLAYMAKAQLSLSDGQAHDAAEYAQIAASQILSTPSIMRVHPVLLAARCCAMAGQQRSTAAYIRQGLIMIDEYKSYHLLSQVRAIQNILDRRDQ